MLGVAPSLDPPAAAQRALPEAMARAVAALWDRIGFSGEQVGGRTWLTPTCGLAGASPGWSRAVGGSLAAAARLLASAD
jgi:L-serine deaminase